MTTRSIVVEGATTTLSLDDDVWRELEAVAEENEMTLSEVIEVAEASFGRQDSLVSALRTYVSRVRH